MNHTGENNHLASSEVLHGGKVYLRPPRLDDLSFIRKLWGDLETMASVGGPVGFPEPNLLRSLGFDRDDAVADVCKMIMTKQMYVTRYGGPKKVAKATRITRAPRG